MQYGHFQNRQRIKLSPEKFGTAIDKQGHTIANALEMMHLFCGSIFQYKKILECARLPSAPGMPILAIPVLIRRFSEIRPCKTGGFSSTLLSAKSARPA